MIASASSTGSGSALGIGAMSDEGFRLPSGVVADVDASGHGSPPCGTSTVVVNSTASRAAIRACS